MSQKEEIVKYLTTGKKRFEKRLQNLTKKSKLFSYCRLSILSGFIIIFLTFYVAGISYGMWASAIIFITTFGMITGKHNKLDFGIKKNRIWINIKTSHLARINLDWNNIKQINFSDISIHPFAEDLNITGSRSLLQLINTAITEDGMRILKNWLTDASPRYNDIAERQLLVKEMVQLTRFRDRLSLCSELVSKKDLKDTVLISWINSPSQIKKIKNILTSLLLLIPVITVLIVLNILGIIPAFWSFPALVYIGINWFNLKYVVNLFDMTSSIKEELGRFAVIFKYIEKYSFRKGSRLEKFCEIYKKNPPSKQFKKLNRLITAASMQNHMITAFLTNAIFPTNFFVAYKFELIKKELSSLLPDWLNTWYELEAYNSLSNYAYLNPDYTFPQIMNSGKINFYIKKAAHPLIHFTNSVSNSFDLNNKGNIALITGSNMSGKSTFLKTIGTNLVLAYAGSVVNAVEMQANVFKIYTCINIMDSLTDGISYFMAEVKRLKALLDELSIVNGIPVLYLIDEIFKGTNNRERLIGSRSYIKRIAELNGAGLISTHDLELIKLENEIATLKNFHFREDVINGKMVFNFKLHDGPCPTTNALKIMELEGLPVE